MAKLHKFSPKLKYTITRPNDGATLRIKYVSRFVVSGKHMFLFEEAPIKRKRLKK